MQQKRIMCPVLRVQTITEKNLTRPLTSITGVEWVWGDLKLVL